MAETPIVSETLQQSFRTNFPSQISSGRDLHVSDTIIPIVDFSSTAGTTGLRSDLQSAISTSGNFNTLTASTTGTTIFSNTGFVRCIGVANSIETIGSGVTYFVEIFINDGTTDYKVYRQQNATLVGSTNGATFVNFDFIVFLRSGDTLQASTSSNAVLNVKTYQIADITGTLVNPQGFTS